MKRLRLELQISKHTQNAQYPHDMASSSSRQGLSRQHDTFDSSSIRGSHRLSSGSPILRRSSPSIIKDDDEEDDAQLDRSLLLMLHERLDRRHRKDVRDSIKEDKYKSSLRRREVSQTLNDSSRYDAIVDPYPSLHGRKDERLFHDEEISPKFSPTSTLYRRQMEIKSALESLTKESHGNPRHSHGFDSERDYEMETQEYGTRQSYDKEREYEDDSDRPSPSMNDPFERMDRDSDESTEKGPNRADSEPTRPKTPTKDHNERSNSRRSQSRGLSDSYVDERGIVHHARRFSVEPVRHTPGDMIKGYATYDQVPRQSTSPATRRKSPSPPPRRVSLENDAKPIESTAIEATKRPSMIPRLKRSSSRGRSVDKAIHSMAKAQDKYIPGTGSERDAIDRVEVPPPPLPSWSIVSDGAASESETVTNERYSPRGSSISAAVNTEISFPDMNSAVVVKIHETNDPRPQIAVDPIPSSIAVNEGNRSDVPGVNTPTKSMARGLDRPISPISRKSSNSPLSPARKDLDPEQELLRERFESRLRKRLGISPLRHLHRKDGLDEDQSMAQSSYYAGSSILASAMKRQESRYAVSMVIDRLEQLALELEKQRELAASTSKSVNGKRLRVSSPSSLKGSPKNRSKDDSKANISFSMSGEYCQLLLEAIALQQNEINDLWEAAASQSHPTHQNGRQSTLFPSTLNESIHEDDHPMIPSIHSEIDQSMDQSLNQSFDLLSINQSDSKKPPANPKAKGNDLDDEDDNMSFDSQAVAALATDLLEDSIRDIARRAKDQAVHTQIKAPSQSNHLHDPIALRHEKSNDRNRASYQEEPLSHKEAHDPAMGAGKSSVIALPSENSSENALPSSERHNIESDSSARLVVDEDAIQTHDVAMDQLLLAAAIAADEADNVSQLNLLDPQKFPAVPALPSSTEVVVAALSPMKKRQPIPLVQLVPSLMEEVRALLTEPIAEEAMSPEVAAMSLNKDPTIEGNGQKSTVISPKTRDIVGEIYNQWLPSKADDVAPKQVADRYSSEISTNQSIIVPGDDLKEELAINNAPLNDPRPQQYATEDGIARARTILPQAMKQRLFAGEIVEVAQSNAAGTSASQSIPLHLNSSVSEPFNGLARGRSSEIRTIDEKLADLDTRIAAISLTELRDPLTGIAKDSNGLSAGKLDVFVICAKNLPAMRRLDKSCDPYVEVCILPAR